MSTAAAEIEFRNREQELEHILDHRFHETGLMHGIHLASEAL
jgi:hypothetical protein